MAMNPSRADIRKLFSFFQLCGKLKHLKRTGWVNHKLKDPETVAGHMYRMAMMCFLFDRADSGVTIKAGPGNEAGGSGACGKPLDRERCVRMALVHDLAESVVGDITPHDGVSREDKHQRELKAMEHIRTLVPDEVGTELYELWKEYEEGTSPEAVVVKDLDAFDMLFQAFEYETSQERPRELQEFFDYKKGTFQHPKVKEWMNVLEQERDSFDDNSK